MLPAARHYLTHALSILPTTHHKAPTLPWKRFQCERMSEAEVAHHFTTAQGIAIICGAISNHLEVIDIDTKHSTNPTCSMTS